MKLCTKFERNRAIRGGVIYHHHHVRVAGEGRCVTPEPWPVRMADLHNVEGMLTVSLRT